MNSVPLINVSTPSDFEKLKSRYSSDGSPERQIQKYFHEDCVHYANGNADLKYSPIACFHRMFGVGEPFASQGITTEFPRITLWSSGSTTHFGGTAHNYNFIRINFN